MLDSRAYRSVHEICLRLQKVSWSNESVKKEQTTKVVWLVTSTEHWLDNKTTPAGQKRNHLSSDFNSGTVQNVQHVK